MSIDQVGGLLKKFEEFGEEHRTSPLLKGFIINKALFAVDSEEFPQRLERYYHATTFGVIPADREAIRAYQKRDVPADIAPDSDFAYFSLSAVENLVAPRANWSPEAAKQFEEMAGPIRVAWAARHRLDGILERLPIAHVGFLVLTLLSYILYKYDLLRGSLSIFYLGLISVMLGTAVASLIVSVRRVRSATRRRIVQIGAASTAILLLLGLVTMAFDVPRTFSRDELFSRVKNQDAQIALLMGRLDDATREVDSTKNQVQFLTIDRDRVSAALSRTQERVDAERRRADAATARAISAQSEAAPTEFERTRLRLVQKVNALSENEAQLLAKRLGLSSRGLVSSKDFLLQQVAQANDKSLAVLESAILLNTPSGSR